MMAFWVPVFAGEYVHEGAILWLRMARQEADHDPTDTISLANGGAEADSKEQSVRSNPAISLWLRPEACLR